MKKFTFILAAILASGATSAFAEEYVTAGDGTAYSFEILSGIEGSNVTKAADGSYEVTADITISNGDSFTLDQGATIKFGNDVRVCLEGTSVMDGGEDRTTFTRTSALAAPRGIWSESAEGPFVMTNVDMIYIGLSDHSEAGATITDCTFTEANGVISSVAAINCGKTGATYVISGCKFTECTVPAVGSGANIFTNLLIEDCELYDNNTSNTNKPQLNLTVGGENPVIVRGCTITGTGRTMVGGIDIGNVLAADAPNKVYIENNTITENRYGITTVGPLYIEIRNNTLINNNHDPNPMTGGSGISLAGYNYGQNGIIAGNHIEGHLWGITLIQCDDINCGQVDNPDSPGGNVFKNNGNGGMKYDLYNNGKNTVYAQLNTWSVDEQTEELIETVISHKNDAPNLGEVIFMPAAETTGISTVEAENDAPACYYNLQGNEVNNPGKGIYIVRRGNVTTKEILR